MTARRPTAPRPAAGPSRTTGAPVAAATPGRPATARTATSRTAGRPATRPGAGRPGSARAVTGRVLGRGIGGRPRPPMVRPLTAVAGVLVVLTLLVAPYVHPWLDQQSEIAAGQDQVARLKQEVDQLTAARARWNDPAYVKAQARQRLRFVMPGDVGFVELDDVPKPSPAADPRQATSAVPDQNSGRPWYDTFWQSVRAAGNAPS